MILGNKYQNRIPIEINGTILYKNAVREGFSIKLPRGSAFNVSIWSEPEESNLQVWIDKSEELIASQCKPHFKFANGYSISYELSKIFIQEECDLITDFQDCIYFYTQTDDYGWFSNFSPHWVTMNGKLYSTVEHYFQSSKFLDSEYAEKIRVSLTPREASILGASREISIRPDWESIKKDIMFQALKMKIETHNEIKELLLETEDKLIIENSPSDYYWGIGKSGTGQNYLGILLMRLRMIYRGEGC